MSINGLSRNSTAFSRITGRTNQPASISSQNADLSYPVPGSRTAKLYSGSEPNAITVSAGAIEYTQRSREIRSTIDSASVDVLVVGGGGAGGRGGNYGSGGGGGGGGWRNLTSVPLSAGSYTITVGAGGAAGPNSRTAPRCTPGGDSSLGSVVVGTGGGSAATFGPPTTTTNWGSPGGSGGGGSSGGGPSSLLIAGQTVASPDGLSPTVQGTAGGRGYFSAGGQNHLRSSAGGGGAGGAGGDSPSGNAGPAGPGLPTPLVPTSYGTPGPNPGRYFAGGGGAGSPGSDTPGGAGGGGNGGPGSAGATNTGGGGGGYNYGSETNGGAGGSGIVVVYIPD